MGNLYAGGGEGDLGRGNESASNMLSHNLYFVCKSMSRVQLILLTFTSSLGLLQEWGFPSHSSLEHFKTIWDCKIYSIHFGLCDTQVISLGLRFPLVKWTSELWSVIFNTLSMSRSSFFKQSCIDPQLNTDPYSHTSIICARVHMHTHMFCEQVELVLLWLEWGTWVFVSTHRAFPEVNPSPRHWLLGLRPAATPSWRNLWDTYPRGLPQT